MINKLKLHSSLAAILILLTASASSARDESEQRGNEKLAIADDKDIKSFFKTLVDKYFESSFRFDPDQATVLGIHDYDSVAPDFSKARLDERSTELRSFLNQFEEIKPGNLSHQEQRDRELITSTIKGKLVTLDEQHEWQRNPDLYTAQSSTMIYDLMSRNFAPLRERLKSVIAREKKIPQILKAASANLKQPPKIYLTIALDQLAGSIEFFEKSVPETFKAISDKDLQDEFAKVNNEVIAALSEYQKFLNELMPKANETFAIGAEIFSKKLLFDEMVDTPLDQLLADGELELKRLQSEFAKTAAEIDPSKTPAEVFKSMSVEHPAPDKLLGSTFAMLKDLREFCHKNEIVTIPPEADLKVEATPSFMRALTFASMNWLGPFEKSTREAYYYVTVPDPSWSSERAEQHMRSYGKYSLMDTSVHEVFPGHYVQGLWLSQAPSKTTKILGSNSNIEGWAHYGEQMMVEQGLENGSKKLKLAMLHKALRRTCRYIVAIRMHTKGMTMDEAISFFMKESFEERTNAERESKRGTIDATYLVYTLGKLQILALREDYRKIKGKDFNLKDFHDQFLSNGCLPVTMIRKIMLPNQP